MENHVDGKSIIITGAGGGFGRLIGEKAAALGAKVTCADINETALAETVAGITAAGGVAQGVATDVASIEDMKALANKAMDAYGRIDVMINNAGIMPLAMYADHAEALEKWHRCIDINFKGVLNGIVAVFDPMMAQGEGHVINISSIYGNFPVVGASVYAATKSAVNFLSESLRVETRGKIKVTTVKPTGVPATGLGESVVNPEGAVGILGQNFPQFQQMTEQLAEEKFDPAHLDPGQMDYQLLDPAYIADAVIHAINQPKGVSIGEITVRAAGDLYIL